MPPVTFRIPVEEIESLDADVEEYGYASRAALLRDIVRHRETILEEHRGGGDHTKDLAELENRIETLEDQMSAITNILNDEFDINEAGGGIEEDGDGWNAFGVE